MTRARTAAALATGVLAGALIVANTATLIKDVDYAELGAYRRLWADLARAISVYVERAYPLPPDRAARRTFVEDRDAIRATRNVVVEKVAQHGIDARQFWRVIRDEPFVRERLRPPPPDLFDDPGRGLLLAAAFRARGGIAPFLILWLAPLLLLPVAAWIACESFRAGAAVAGAVFLALIGLSPFLLETLAFARSAAGFYLLALAVVVPLGLHALVGPPPTASGLVARWAVAGLVFGVCALCRSGALLALAGFAIVFAGALARMLGETKTRAMAGLLAAGLFAAPFLVLRQPERHDVWAGVWEGLGDFDRSKGHTWSDPVAEEVARRGGAPGLRTPEAMEVLRAEVIAHVRGDPGWYAGILARRLFATVTQQRLWPSVRADGIWMARSDSPNEGFMDKYYGYTTTADFLGFGNARQVELPVALMLLPTVAFFAWSVVNAGLRPRAFVVLAIMAAALPLPVLISTAGAVEPQAFTLAYALGAAFLADAIAGLARDTMRARAESTAPGRASRLQTGDR